MQKPVGIGLIYSMCLAICGLVVSSTLAADQPASGFDTLARPFLKQYCIECHGPDKQKGELRLDGIADPGKNLSAAPGWSDILDRITLGEMPPKKHPIQPPAEESRRMVTWIRDSLRQAETAALSRGGRVVMRRLNRAEYENTVRDLLGVDLRVGDELPADPKAADFDNVGAALSMSPLHIEKFAKLAEEAIALAVDPRPTRPETELWHFEIQESPTQPSDGRPAPNSVTEIRHVRGGDLAEPLVKRHPALIDPALAKTNIRAATHPFLFRFEGEGKARGTWGLSPGVDGKTNGSDLNRFHIQNFLVREGGEYRIRVRTRCDFDPLTWSHEMPRFQVKPAPTGNRLYLDGVYRAPGQVEVFEGRFRVATGERLNLRMGKANYQTDLKYNPEMRTPQVWVDWVEIEGPCFDFEGWPSPTQRELFGDWTTTAEPPSPAQLRDILKRFLSRAFRRPPTAEEVALRERVVGNALKAGLPPVEAVSLSFISAMTSAPFAYLVEPRQGDAKRELNDWELASRLSYFLWGTMPDPRLRELASAGKLRDPSVLAGEARRMLNDPRSRFLCERFASQWLELTKLSTIAPDPAIYPEWTEPLRADLRAETIAFFTEVLYAGKPLNAFLNSDFAMLNDRLAAHYRIPGVVGSHFRPVPLRPEWNRGGLIGQGGLLTMTSNGTRTLPVARGVFLLDRVFDNPPPPPPANAGEIDNKVPGEDKVTVRERLAIHRKVEACASCHAKIDPLGFALENYNAIGRWQLRESSGDPNRPYKLGSPVDASGTMADGRPFQNLAEFQNIMCAEEERFLRGLVKRMLVFGLGRVVDFGDRALIQKLTDQLKTTGTMTELIVGIVSSEQFRTK